MKNDTIAESHFYLGLAMVREPMVRIQEPPIHGSIGAIQSRLGLYRFLFRPIP